MWYALELSLTSLLQTTGSLRNSSGSILWPSVRPRSVRRSGNVGDVFLQQAFIALCQRKPSARETNGTNHNHTFHHSARIIQPGVYRCARNLTVRVMLSSSSSSTVPSSSGQVHPGQQQQQQNYQYPQEHLGKSSPQTPPPSAVSPLLLELRHGHTVLGGLQESNRAHEQMGIVPMPSQQLQQQQLDSLKASGRECISSMLALYYDPEET